jgi:hypothetical protein
MIGVAMFKWSCDVNLMIDGATMAGCAVAVRGGGFSSWPTDHDRHCQAP